MAYIRWGEALPSGKRSASYVFGGPDGLVSGEGGGLIPYDVIRQCFRTGTDAEVKEELGRRLALQGEELEVVCQRLFDERKSGGWEEPFGFEKK